MEFYARTFWRRCLTRRTSTPPRCTRLRLQASQCFPGRNIAGWGQNLRQPSVRCPDPPEESKGTRSPTVCRVRLVSESISERSDFDLSSTRLGRRNQVPAPGLFLSESCGWCSRAESAHCPPAFL